MYCKLITTASDYSRTEMLRKSLDKNGWKYHIIIHEWRGFGDKILKTYEYLKSNPQITHFFYSDSYDTVAVKTMENTLNNIDDYSCILLSAEKNCYPHKEKEILYPQNKSDWKYVNGGGWFCNTDIFIKAVESNPLKVETVDQVWFTDLFLNNQNIVKLDYNCKVFQTIAFTNENDFSIIIKQYLGNRDFSDICGEKIFKLINNIHGTEPTFWHGNGHTCMDKFYKLI